MAAPVIPLLLRLLGGGAARAGFGRAASAAGPGMTNLLRGGAGAARTTRRAAEIESLRRRIDGKSRMDFGVMADRHRIAHLLREQRAEQRPQLGSGKVQELGSRVRQANKEFAGLSRTTTGLLVAGGLAAGSLRSFSNAADKARNMKLEHFSPRLARLGAEREVFDIKQRAELAKSIAPTIEAVERQRMQLQARTLKYRTMKAQFGNVWELGKIKLKESIAEWAAEKGIGETIELLNKAINLHMGGRTEGQHQLLKRLGEIKDGPTHRALNRAPDESPGGRI